MSVDRSPCQLLLRYSEMYSVSFKISVSQRMDIEIRVFSSPFTLISFVLLLLEVKLHFYCPFERGKAVVGRCDSFSKNQKEVFENSWFELHEVFLYVLLKICINK